MKKVIILVLIIGALVALYFAYTPSKNIDNTADTSSSSFKPDPSNATFAFDGEDITLSGGRNEKSISDTSSIKETFALEDMRAYGDLNADGKTDTAVVITRSGGGSGVFIHVAAYVSGNVSYKGTDALFVGDRISPQSISVSNGVVVFKYLDRRDDEPFAAEPTIQRTKQFVYKAGKFIEK